MLASRKLAKYSVVFVQFGDVAWWCTVRRLHYISSRHHYMDHYEDNNHCLLIWSALTVTVSDFSAELTCANDHNRIPALVFG